MFLPGLRRTCQLPDIKRRLAEGVFHVSGRRITELDKIIIQGKLLIFLGDECLQRLEERLAILRTDIVADNSGKSELLAACSGRRLSRERLQVGNQDCHIPICQRVARHDIIKSLPGRIDPHPEGFCQSIPGVGRPLDNSFGIDSAALTIRNLVKSRRPTVRFIKLVPGRRRGYDATLY